MATNANYQGIVSSPSCAQSSFAPFVGQSCSRNGSSCQMAQGAAAMNNVNIGGMINGQVGLQTSMANNPYLISPSDFVPLANMSLTVSGSMGIPGTYLVYPVSSQMMGQPFNMRVIMRATETLTAFIYLFGYNSQTVTNPCQVMPLMIDCVNLSGNEYSVKSLGTIIPNNVDTVMVVIQNINDTSNKTRGILVYNDNHV